MEPRSLLVTRHDPSTFPKLVVKMLPIFGSSKNLQKFVRLRMRKRTKRFHFYTVVSLSVFAHRFMYFNGEPYGDHTTPHARTLPWERPPKVIAAPVRKPLFNDDMMPSSRPAFDDEFRNPSLRSAINGISNGPQSRYGQAMNLEYDVAKLNGHRDSSPSSPNTTRELTEEAIREAKIKHCEELRHGMERGVVTVKTRLRAAAYTAGGTDYERLFRFYDRNNDGSISKSEFISLVRKDGKITRGMMTDRELKNLFDFVDVDRSSSIDHRELVGWILGKAVSELSEQDMRGSKVQDMRGSKATRSSSSSGVGAVEMTSGNHRSDAKRKLKEQIGELRIGIGRKPGSDRPKSTLKLIIREGDDPGDIVQRLRRKGTKLFKGQADHIVLEIRNILNSRQKGSIVVVDASIPTPKKSRRASVVRRAEDRKLYLDYQGDPDDDMEEEEQQRKEEEEDDETEEERIQQFLNDSLRPKGSSFDSVSDSVSPDSEKLDRGDGTAAGDGRFARKEIAQMNAIRKERNKIKRSQLDQLDNNLELEGEEEEVIVEEEVLVKEVLVVVEKEEEKKEEEVVEVEEKNQKNKIKQLEIQLIRCKAENRGLCAEIKELRIALELFASNDA